MQHAERQDIDESRHDPAGPKPAVIPRPTPWPVILAFGITFAVWGVVTSWIYTGVGAAITVAGLGGWIWEMWHDE